MPGKKRRKKINWGRWLSSLLLLVIICLYFIGPSWLNQIQLISDDAKFKLRGPRDPGDEVVIVAVDDHSLAEMGRWPWSRQVHARLLERLAEYRVKVVGLDMFFPEPEVTGEKVQLEKLEKQARKLKVKPASYLEILQQMKQQQDHDSLLAKAIKDFGRVVMPLVFFAKEGGGTMPGIEDNVVTTFRNVEFLNLVEAPGVLTSLAKLNKAGRNVGFIDMFSDDDGVYRWAPCYIQYRGNSYLHLSLQMTRLFLNLGMSEIAVDGGQAVDFGGRMIPTDDIGRMFINYCGGEKTFPTYSYADVYNGKIAREKLEGRIVLVGVTATGVYDVRLTPYDKVFPGVEIHANIIENVLHETFVQQVDEIINLLWLVAIGLILIIFLPRVSPLNGLLVAVGLATAHLLLSFQLFKRAALVINDVYPLLLLLLIYITITVYKFITEESEKKFIKNVFQRFVTKSVMEEILDNPDDLILGGAEKNLTVLFSDIRSFTTYSENHTPHQVVAILNEYLTAMTDTVFDTEGTLDKYVGDEIMAFWGSPLGQLDHARRACKSALAMMDCLQNELYTKWRGEGREVFDIGIGVNTGEMLVGYMGSQSRMDYTLIGDNVNLGARLEGTNKQYKTNIIISDSTYQQVKDEFVVRELDLIRVKGKKEGVRIYELLAMGELDEKMSEVKRTFEEGLALYRDQKWDEASKKFQEVLKLRKEDGPAGVFVARCKSMKETGPGSNWDGVFEMTTK